MQGYPTSRLSEWPPSLKDLSGRQQKLWKARARGDVRTIQTLLSPQTVLVSLTGAKNLKEIVSQIEGGVCKVDSFKLDHFALSSATQYTGMLSYQATEDATCNGKPLPAVLQVKVGYRNSDGKWIIGSYVEENLRASN